MREVEQERVSGKVPMIPNASGRGFTTEQIVQRLRDNDDVLVGDVKELPREGSLLPETYKFVRARRQALLTIMAKAQAKAVEEIWKKRPDLPIKSRRTRDARIDRREGNRQGR